jgi:phosphoglycerate dehydrogenase-like enzyme
MAAPAHSKVFYTGFSNQEMYDIVSEPKPPGFDFVTLRADSNDERMEKVADADYVILFSLRLPDKTWTQAPRLKMIQLMGVGYHDMVDLELLKKHNIRLGIAPFGTSIGVSEHAIMLMMAVGKRLPFVDRGLREGKWMQNTLRNESRQLFNTTVGIVGLGRIGRGVARRLQAFGCTVLYHDVLDLDVEIEREVGAQRVSFDELLARSDFVSLHLPLTPESHHLMNAKTIAKMKRGAILINTARGPVVEQAALIEALKSGHLGGAGLDVFEHEPLGHPNPFAELHNVVLTPHHSPGTRDIMRMKAQQIWRNIERFHRGQPVDDMIV